MTYITKCKGTGCPLKESCHRYTSKDSDKQDYFVTPPFDKKLNTCQMIWNENAEELYKGLQRLTRPTN